MQGHFTLNGGGKSDVTRRFSVSMVPTLSCISGAAAADLTKWKRHRANVIPRGRGLRVWRRNRPSMSTKSRELIWGGRIMGAEIRAQGAREVAESLAIIAKSEGE